MLSGKNILIILFIIFAANFILRLILISDSNLWYDEVFSVYQSQKDISLIKEISRSDIAPPFYYYILHFWMQLFGIGENSVRILSILFMSIAAAFLFFMAYKYFGFDTAIFTSVLFFSSNQIFFYAQEARTYSLLILLAIVSSHLFFKLIDKPKIIYVLLLGVINWAAVYSHYFFILLIAIQLGISIVSGKGKTVIYFILSIIITLIIFNTWLLRIKEVVIHGSTTSFDSTPTISDFLSILFELLNGKLVFIILIIPFVIGVYFFLKKISFRNDYSIIIKLTYLIAWGFLPLIFVFATGSKGIMFIPRYFLFSIPGILILFSFFILQIHKKRIVIYSLIALIGLCSLFSIQYKISKGYDFRGTSSFIKSIKDENTLVILEIAGTYPGFTYYFDRGIFKNYREMGINLLKNNILPKDDTTNLTNEMITGYYKIILAQTFRDESSEVFAFFNKRYQSENSFRQFPDILITVFENPHKELLSKDYFQTQDKKQIEIYRKKVYNSSSWLKQIQTDALNQNIPFDTILNKNIVWVLNQNY